VGFTRVHAVTTEDSDGVEQVRSSEAGEVHELADETAIARGHLAQCLAVLVDGAILLRGDSVWGEGRGHGATVRETGAGNDVVGHAFVADVEDASGSVMVD